jgi:hypothetical protein
MRVHQAMSAGGWFGWVGVATSLYLSIYGLRAVWSYSREC